MNDFSEWAFAILRPDLFSECCKIRTVLCQHVEELKNLRSRFCLRFMVGAGDNSMFGEEDVVAITDMAYHSEKVEYRSPWMSACFSFIMFKLEFLIYNI